MSRPINPSESGDDNAIASSGQAAPIPPSPALLQRMEGSLELMTGERVHVRPIRADDTARLQAFHAHLSSDSVVFRFFRYLPALSDADAEHFTHVDYMDRMALVATQELPAGERILGVVRYDRIGPDTAEVAFVVEDRWQGHGIATALLHRLAAVCQVARHHPHARHNAGGQREDAGGAPERRLSPQLALRRRRVRSHTRHQRARDWRAGAR